MRVKNPLHPSALTVNDLTIGRRIILFSTLYGIVHEATVMSRPYVTRTFESYLMYLFFPKGLLTVDIRLHDTGEVIPHDLDQLGVIRFSEHSPFGGGTWSQYGFVIDASKRDLLPEIEDTPAHEHSHSDGDEATTSEEDTTPDENPVSENLEGLEHLLAFIMKELEGPGPAPVNWPYREQPISSWSGNRTGLLERLDPLINQEGAYDGDGVLGDTFDIIAELEEQ